MKIIQINTVPYGSTGTIMMNIHKELLNRGHESYVVWGRGRNSNNNNEFYLDDKIGVYYHVLYSRLTGKHGFASKKSTKKLISWIDKINPDIIHLHNIHGYYINVELLFNYIKEKNIRVVWTLHDCWAFTGHCTHYIYADCQKWKNRCSKCPLSNSYPKSFFDSSGECFNRKKDLFTSVNNLTFVTPSLWLQKQLQQSFFKEYKSYVINNGINVDKFKLKENNEFKRKYDLNDKIVLLGIASPWIEKKGLKDFLLLNDMIDKKIYKIVLVGLSEKQVKKLPDDIIKIKRTTNVDELIDIYNDVDYLINPTYEDNYPTINVEAISCGTPVITYDTGGSPEILKNNNYGIIVKKKKNYFCDDNVIELYNTIINAKINKKNMTMISKGLIDINVMINNYFDLYDEMVGEKL